ncbi:hypothetical protein [Streptomyces olivaceus]|uniref:hypothetical protein n=1 Tax=Streptomyces olivaceus TaxID=47716 RepID=UPI0004CB27B4|nr:hypothetical protein [Streptomyces olivaceus]
MNHGHALRCGLHLPSDAELALRYGVSGFVLASDEPADLNLFGHEVAPRARELVESERVT